jgi:hypothetical protein
LPAIVAAAGERASMRFLELFSANIRNPHTRRAYARAADEFLAWCASAGVLPLGAAGPRIEIDDAYIGAANAPVKAPDAAGAAIRPLSLSLPWRPPRMAPVFSHSLHPTEPIPTGIRTAGSDQSSGSALAQAQATGPQDPLQSTV